MDRNTRDRLRKAVKKTEQTKTRQTPQRSHASPGSWKLFELVDELTEAEETATAKVRYWNGSSWETETEEVEIRPWKLNGATVPEGSEIWCLHYSGEWWGLIPEDCPE